MIHEQPSWVEVDLQYPSTFVTGVVLQGSATLQSSWVTSFRVFHGELNQGGGLRPYLDSYGKHKVSEGGRGGGVESHVGIGEGSYWKSFDIKQ